MQLTYRATRKLRPNPGETLVGSPEQARKIIAGLDQKISNRNTSGNEKAVALCARATLYSALGDPKMLEAAKDAHKYTKTANSTALVAVALHHFGRVKESLRWYEQAWRYPHEEGFEIDIGYSNALLFQPTRWHEAWPIVKNLKKRMVYALYLPFWDGKPVDKLSIISEGGFGDLIQNCRWLPHAQKLAKDITVYLPPYFFEHGFSALASRQPWFPKIESLLKVPKGVPSAGFFDLPAIWDADLNNIPTYPQMWKPAPNRQIHSVSKADRIRVGFCHSARAMETPLCPQGIYRALTPEQAQSVLRTDRVEWVSLQKDENPDLKSWEDTAALISTLDAVISVDTAVFHLAAAMGKPTYVLLSGAIDWKFGLEGDETIRRWYPTVSLFRNDGWGMENAVEKLISFIAEGKLHEECRQAGPQETVREYSNSL